jgi:CheY-like chemotaxis protein
MKTSQWLILVVEDDDECLRLVLQVLKRHHIRALTARDGMECLQTLSKVQPTMILMDLMMPVMNGWDTLAEIRANPKTAPLPVIALTAHCTAEVVADTLQAGFEGCICKPIGPTFVAQLAKFVPPSARAPTADKP